MLGVHFPQHHSSMSGSLEGRFWKHRAVDIQAMLVLHVTLVVVTAVECSSTHSTRLLQTTLTLALVAGQAGVVRVHLATPLALVRPPHWRGAEDLRLFLLSVHRFPLAGKVWDNG